jgi:hypothetical protein
MSKEIRIITFSFCHGTKSYASAIPGSSQNPADIFKSLFKMYLGYTIAINGRQRKAA